MALAVVRIGPCVLTRGMTRSRQAFVRSAAAVIFVFSAAASHAKDCPPGNASSGARRTTDRAGCPTTETPRRPDERPALKAGQRPGFIDLGGGTEVRIGGRARLDMDRSR
jgi:hypothetical protein